MGYATYGAIVSALVGIVSSVIGIPEDKIPTDVSFQDGLNIDSAGMLEVILAVESRFEVNIPDAEIGWFADRSIEDTATWICDNCRLQTSSGRDDQ